MAESKKRRPCHLVAGPLGVGKTSAILDYLKNKQDDERIAVLVNDFGANGLDGVILNEEGTPSKGALAVTSVPGGCLCCTSSIYFETHLRELAKAEDIDRIIIEPSGIVMLDQMKGLLYGLGDSLALDIRPVVVLVNVARFNVRHFTEMPYFGKLAQEADVLVGNRCDLATEAQIEKFLAFAGSLNSGGKEVYTTTYGRLPAGVFAGGATRAPGDVVADRNHVHQKERRSGSLEWTVENCFDHQRLMEGLAEWVGGLADRADERLKGTFHTDQGWKLVEVAQGQLYSRDFTVQKKSQVEWILSDSEAPESLILSTLIEERT